MNHFEEEWWTARNNILYNAIDYTGRALRNKRNF